MSELGLVELNKRGLLKGYETGKLKFCERQAQEGEVQHFDSYN